MTRLGLPAAIVASLLAGVLVTRGGEPASNVEKDLIARILKVAKPTTNWWDTPDHRHTELTKAQESAMLIVEGFATNRTRISSASGKWIKGWPETYPVMIIAPSRSIRGSYTGTNLIAEYMRSGSVVVLSAFPSYSIPLSEKCVFFMNRNERVSKWSGRTVYDVILSVQISASP